MRPEINHAPLVTAGTFLGLGMGGFVDGILFHQILQIHNMLSARVPKTTIPNIEINMFWDGMFHAFTWVMTAIGIAMLWKAARRVDVPWLGKVLVGDCSTSSRASSITISSICITSTKRADNRFSIGCSCSAASSLSSED